MTSVFAFRIKTTMNNGLHYPLTSLFSTKMIARSRTITKPNDSKGIIDKYVTFLTKEYWGMINLITDPNPKEEEEEEETAAVAADTREAPYQKQKLCLKKHMQK